MVAIGMSKLLEDAQAGGYAIGYFEVWNLESVRALSRRPRRRKLP